MSITNDNTLSRSCGSSKALKKYLCYKGKNHNHYKSYSTLERVSSIRDDKALYLNDGKKWNDVVDRNNFNDESSPVVNFGKCFSFSQDESVAMWMLYGGIDKLSGMIDFTNKGMRTILDTASVSVGYFDGNAFKTGCILEKNDFDIFVTDVIYYRKDKASYYVTRSDEAFNKLSKEIFEEMRICRKSYPWKYENECRLIVSIKRNLIDKKFNVVKIDLANMDLGKSFERIYRGPNYSLKDTKNSLPSKLDNTIDWTLCEREKCSRSKEKIDYVNLKM